MNFNYKNGLKILEGFVKKADAQTSEEFDLFKSQLLINLDEENRHGSTDRIRADKNRIIQQLNVLTRRLTEKLFVDLCQELAQPAYRNSGNAQFFTGKLKTLIHNRIKNALVKVFVGDKFQDTGFLITPDGHVLTAYHRIGDYALEIVVETYFGERFNMRLDEDKSLKHIDIAVLKVLKRQYYTEHCLPLGMISDKHGMDEIVAVGYPAQEENSGINFFQGKIYRFNGNKFESDAMKGIAQSSGPIYHYAMGRIIGLTSACDKPDVMMNTGVAARFAPLFKRWPELELINEWVAQSWDEGLKNIPKEKKPLLDEPELHVKQKRSTALPQLDNDDKEQLKKLLLECSTMQNEDSRNNLVEQLQPHLSSTIKFSEDIKLHVRNIFNACLKNRDGIEELIDLLDWMEEDKMSIHAMENILAPKSITKNELKELKLLLKSFHLPDDNKLKAIYDECVPKNMSAPQDCHDKSRLDCLLDWLTDMGLSSNGHVPMLDFVARLIPDIKDSMAKDNLKAWIKEVGEHLTLTSEQIFELFKKNELQQSATVSSPLYLLIELEPESSKRDNNFTIYAWCVKSPNDIKNVILEDDKTFTLDDMPELIDKLLASINDDLIAANDQLTIEFFLPFHLLCYPVEHWNIPSLCSPLGIFYRVVIRSQERLRDERFWPPWKAHLNVHKLPKIVSDNDIVWMNENKFQEVHSKLRGTDAICLVMTFPHEKIVDPKQAMLSLAIRLGAPIALWPRKMDESDDIQQELSTLLSAGPLESLPEFVRKKREEKWGKEEHKAGYNLSLLWDDFNRIPINNLECPTQV